MSCLRLSRSLLRQSLAPKYISPLSLKPISPRNQTFQLRPQSKSNLQYRYVSDLPQKKDGQEQTAQGGVRMFHSEELTKFDKWILVSSKVYPDQGSIPERIPPAKIKTAQDRMRVKVATYMVVGTLLACLVVSVYSSMQRRKGTIPNLNERGRKNLGMEKKE